MNKRLLTNFALAAALGICGYANADPVLYNNTTNFVTTSNNPSEAVLGFQGGANTANNGETAMWADDIFPDPTLQASSPPVTEITLIIDDQISGTWPAATPLNLIMTFWSDNGSDTSPAVNLETIERNITPQLSTGIDVISFPTQAIERGAGDPLGAIPSLMWVGVQFQSTLNTGGATPTYFDNFVGMVAYGTPTVGSTSGGIFAGTLGGPQTDPPVGSFQTFFPSYVSAGGTPSGPMNFGLMLQGPEPASLSFFGAATLYAATRRKRTPVV